MDTSITEMDKQLDLPTLKERRLIHLAMDCYNNISNAEAGLHKLVEPIDKDRLGEHVTKTKT